jgi:Trypsin-like peptidase domain
MFADAIAQVETFTRPLRSIMRLYGHDKIVPGSATLFFVNDAGVAVTCKHVAELVMNANAIQQHYRNFQVELRALPQDVHRAGRLVTLEEKYKFRPETAIQVKNNFTNCVEQPAEIKIDLHPTQDLAVLRFLGHRRTHYTGHAVFLRDSARLRPGRSLCRLGYPFPEFSDYRYNPDLDDIEFIAEGRNQAVSFPIDGMVTRLLGADAHSVTGLEMSTPGLRGQSGGPLFDSRGLIAGMQTATRHLHLGFDIENMEVLVNGRRTQVSNYPFLNVGLCVHADIIKAFLRELDVVYHEA